MEKENKTTNEKNTNYKMAYWYWVIAQMVFVAIFLLGGFSGEKKESFIEAVKRIIKLFDWNSSIWYNYAGSFLHGVLFMFFAYRIVKNVIETFRLIKMQKVYETRGVKNLFLSSIQWPIVYLILTNLIYENKLSGFAIFFIILGFLTLLGGELIEYFSLKAKYSEKYLINDNAGRIVRIILIWSFTAYAVCPVIENIFDGIRIIFSSSFKPTSMMFYFSIYQLLIKQVLSIFLVISACSLIDSVLLDSKEEEGAIWNKAFRKVLIFLIIDFAFYCLISVYEEMDVALYLKEYAQSICATFIPMIIITLAGKSTLSLPKFPAYKQKKVKTAQKTQLQTEEIQEIK